MERLDSALAVYNSNIFPVEDDDYSFDSIYREDNVIILAITVFDEDIYEDICTIGSELMNTQLFSDGEYEEFFSSLKEFKMGLGCRCRSKESGDTCEFSVGYRGTGIDPGLM